MAAFRRRAVLSPTHAMVTVVHENITWLRVLCNILHKFCFFLFPETECNGAKSECQEDHVCK